MRRGSPTSVYETRVGLPRDRTLRQDRRSTEGFTAALPLAAGRGHRAAAQRCRAGQTLIGDKNYFGREFEQQLAELDIRLLRPARKGEAERAGSQLLKPLRQVIESVNETFKCQLDLERHRGRTPGGVAVRVLQRILALTPAIWHNDHTGQPVMRALTAYDH